MAGSEEEEQKDNGKSDLINGCAGCGCAIILIILAIKLIIWAWHIHWIFGLLIILILLGFFSG